MSKKLKKIMTDLAAGRISQTDVDKLIKSKKVSQKRSVGQSKGKILHKKIKQVNKTGG